MKTPCLPLSLLAVFTLASLSPALADHHEEKKAPDDGWLETMKPGEFKKHWTTEGNWSMDDKGVVRLKPREGESGWQRYNHYVWLKDRKYEDFEVKFDYKVEDHSNSGFYFNVGDMKSPVSTGMEVQIYDSHGKDPAKLTDHDSGGFIPGGAPSKNTAKPEGEWNQFHIISKDGVVTVKLNGEKVNELKLDTIKGKPSSGYIGFQDHAHPLALRNFKIRKLD